MTPKTQKTLGGILILIGIILVLNSSLSVTGFAIVEDIGKWTGSLLGLVFVIGGIVLFVGSLEDLEESEEIFPQELYMYVTPKSLQEGISLRGWDPNDLCVPAFDPSKKDPKLVKNLFGFGKDRILVKVSNDFKKYFFPRLTGPEKKSQGVYASKRFVPSKAMIPLDQKDAKQYELSSKKKYT